MAETATNTAPAPGTSRVQSAGSPETGAKPGNISLATLSSMLSKPRDAAGTPSTAAPTETPAPAPNEHAKGKGKGKAKAVTPAPAATPAPELAAPDLGAEPETPETPETPAAPETPETPETAETPETGELGGEAEGEETPEARKLPDELQAAIDELKAGGQNVQAKMLKRIHKLADARDTERMGRLQAEQRATAAEQKAAAVERQSGERPSGTGADRYAGHPDVRTMDRQIAQAESVLQWAESNPDGAEVEGQTYTAEEMRGFRRQAESNRIKLTAERASKVTALQGESTARRQQFNSAARKKYTWLTRPDSPEYVRATHLVNAWPGLKEAPAMELIVARYLRGEMAEKAEAAAPLKPKPTAQRTPPPVATGPSAAPAPQVDPKKGAKSQPKEIMKVGDLSKMFANNMAAKKAA